MTAWLEEREKKWDVHHLDDILCGNGVMDTVTRVIAVTEQGQKQKENGTRKADTDGIGLEALKHLDMMQTGGLQQPEELQQAQPGP